MCPLLPNFSDAGDALADRGREYMNEVRDYVETHSVPAIDKTGAVGFAFGASMHVSDTP